LDLSPTDETSSLEVQLQKMVANGLALDFFEQEHREGEVAKVQRRSLRYENALELWARGDRATALDALAGSALSQRVKRRAYFFLAVQLAMLLIAIYMILLGVCFFLLPTLSALQEESFSSPGIGLRSLQSFGAILPVWAIAAPLTGFALLLLFRMRWRRRTRANAKSGRQSFLLDTEGQGSLDSPVQVSLASFAIVIIAGVLVLLVSYWIYGTTIALFTDLVRVGAELE
jgi:hypothetical protein